MPLTAVDAGGVLLDGTQVTSEAWAAVHKIRPRPVLQCRACNTPMHAKVSSQGLRFFAHDHVRPDCPVTGETADHRWLKSRLAYAIRAAGWVAVVEAAPTASDQGGWRADVLAVAPDGRRVAFEAQLAPMTTAEGRERTDRYRHDAIETWWITLRHAPWLWTLPGVKVEADGEGPLEEDGLPPLRVTRGCAKYVDGDWVHPDAVPLPKLVGLLLDRRVAAYELHYLSEKLAQGSQERFLSHRDAIAIVAVGQIEAEERRRAREADEHRRYEVERAKRAQNVEALYERQRRALPAAFGDATSAARPGESVWLGIPPSVALSAGDVTLENAFGNEKSAMSAVVWVGASRDDLRLFGVVCPVASRITPGLAGSWRRRGVRVYLAEPQELQRVATALGWHPRLLRLFEPSEIRKGQVESAGDGDQQQDARGSHRARRPRRAPG